MKSIDLLAELPFHEQLSIIKTNQAFTGYAMSYQVEVVEKKDPIVQLEASKSSIKDLFSNLLNETKGFKYQITVKILLKKYKLNEEIEFAPVYFNSVTELVINNQFKLEKSFQEILYKIDACINNRSGWIIESIELQYINISTYRKDCLSINGVQSVKVEDGIIKFEDYFKQLPAPSKIYADFECDLKNIEIYEGTCTKKIMITFLVALLTKLFVFMIDLISRLSFTEAKMMLMN